MKRKFAILGTILAVILLALAAFPPAALAELTYLDIDGTYTVGAFSAKYLNGNVHVALPKSTLTINNTGEAVGAVLSGLGADITLTGFLGSGSHPYISLNGTDSVGSYITITGKVILRNSVVKGITGRVDGYMTSEGKKATNSGGTSTSAFYTGAASRGAVGYSALLTKGTGSASSTYIQFDNPKTPLKVSSLVKMPAGYSFWYYLSAVPGPQFELHFESSNGIGWVDVTVMPAQGQWGVAATWTHVTLTSSTISTIYYGEDSIDGTAFDFASGGKTLGEMLALINAETEMAGCTANNWSLTRVRIELWEAGARTCYIDDVEIAGRIYTFEPLQFWGSLSAVKQ